MVKVTEVRRLEGNCLTRAQDRAPVARIAPAHLELAAAPARARDTAACAARTAAERYILNVQMLAGFSEVLEFQKHAL